MASFRIFLCISGCKHDDQGKQRCDDDLGKQQCDDDQGKQRCDDDQGKQRCDDDQGKQRCDDDLGKQQCDDDQGKQRCDDDQGKQRCDDDQGKQRCDDDLGKQRCDDDQGKQQCDDDQGKQQCDDDSMCLFIWPRPGRVWSELCLNQYALTSVTFISVYFLFPIASFNVLLKRLNTSNVSPQLPPFILSKIQRLRDMASEFSDMATPYVIANDPLYYSNIGQTIEKGLFELNYNTRDVSRQVVLWRRTSVESMGEEDSDFCLGEIFGTRNSIECAFTDKCWSLMTQFGYNGYSMSHEIFFLEIAEGYGCQKEVQQQIIVHKQPALTQLQDTFCANMLDEANRIAQMGFPPSLQDLFMEQAALCGMLGFREFFNNDWLTKILSWQDAEDGCYKWSGWNPEDFSSRSSGRHSRNKREEKRVYRGCLCHRSTVAASALSQYVRYILEVWLKEHM
ncbi:hypothetical protein Btru_068297 [Bulinus truncatus]|nr:hypothetical protein Btru_068297 [Bulinus truncatus]